MPEYFPVSHRFPLSNRDDYQGIVTFESLNVDALRASIGRTALTALQGAGQVATTDEFGRNRAANVTRQQVDALYNGVSNTRIITSTTPGVRSDGKVTLYLPAVINFNDAVQYADVQLGAVGGAVAAGIAAGKNVSGLLAGAGEQLLNQMENLSDAFIQGLSSEAAQLALVKTTRLASSNIEGAIATETGIAFNPNRRSTLQGVAIRRFRFTFKLIPNNQAESNEIKRIINFFRKEMYPEDYTGGTAVSLGYRFPNKFEIRLKYKNNEVATRILPSFLENFDAVYNPNSMGFHSDGNFPEVDISLSFVEERALRKQDIQIGY